MREVVVEKKALERLKNFYPWVYKSQIKAVEKYKPAELVKVVNERGGFVAKGYINPKSTIAFRALSFKDEPIDRKFFVRSFQKALALREGLPSDAYRIVHSEADGLPGLVVDRYKDLLSLSFTTLGMLRFKEVVLDALKELLKPKGIYVAADEKMALKEGFEPFTQEIGDVSECLIRENGIKFFVDVKNAQKTGFYLDQRANRAKLASYIPTGAKMLDCFSNSGGFGLYGAVKQEAHVKLVDISQEALEQAKRNFAINEVDGEFIRANVFDFLRTIRGKEKYDVVVLDPPSFAKSRAQKDGAMRGFKDIAVNGMKVVKQGGILALFSCSYHIGIEDLTKILLKAAKDNGKRLLVLEHLYQDKDHPILLNIPNSLYLTGLLVKVQD